jgi:glycerol-3-phosphate acyltransferase PlsY
MNSSQILFLVATYLVGSIPFGFILAKVFAKTDIRKNGSKNIGATNVTRVVGKKLGILTLILDGLKGVLMVLLAKAYLSGIDLRLFLPIVAFIAVIGHIFPIYLNFKGGKGVATAIAVLLALNLNLGIITVIVFITVFVIFRLVSLASLLAIFSAMVTSYFISPSLEETYLCLVLFILISVRHHENIKRLLDGKETTIVNVTSKKKKSLKKHSNVSRKKDNYSQK